MDESPPPKSDRTWLYVGLSFVVFWAAYLAFFAPRIGRDGLPTPRLEGTGTTLPADMGWTLQDLDGKPVSFGAYAGRPVLLNLWATWCGPCRAEMPGLARLAADPRLKGVAFVAVTVEAASDAVRRVAREELPGFAVLRADRVPEVFSTDAIPATYLIDADGKVVASQIGSARWDDPTVAEFLEKLARPAPARP